MSQAFLYAYPLVSLLSSYGLTFERCSQVGLDVIGGALGNVDA